MISRTGKRAAAANGEALVLIGGDTPEEPMTWVLVEIDTAAIVAQGVLGAEEMAPAAAPTQTILIVPGAEAQVKRVEIQARTTTQARSAAPYLFEGVLAVERDIHYAVGETEDQAGARLVAAISGARLSDWLRQARVHGADPQHAYLDFTLWPSRPGEVAIVQTPRRCIVSGGAMGGFSIEPRLAPSLFTGWLDRLGTQPSVVAIYGGEAEAWKPLVSVPIEYRAVKDTALALAAAAVSAPAYAPDLCQGPFAAKKEAATQKWHVWRLAGALAVLAVMLQVASLSFAGWRDHQDAAALLARAERQFLSARPEVRRITNLRAQVRAAANAMNNTMAHPVLSLSEPSIRALQTQPMARLDAVVHEAPSRAVRLRFSAYQPSQLEGVEANLRAEGLSVEAGELSSIEGEVHVELVVETPQ